MRQRVFYLLKLTLSAAAYYFLGKLAMIVAVNGLISPLWPASGLALGVLLRYGKGMWPGILVGALLASYIPGVPIWTVIAVGVGNAVSALLGSYLIIYFCGTNKLFQQVRNVFKFVLFGGLISPIVDTTIGVSSLWLAGSITTQGFLPAWFSWWVSGAVGVVIVAPLTLTWTERTERWKRPGEFLLVLCLVTTTSQLIFSGWITGSIMEALTLKFLLVPFYVWLIFRFGPREIGTTTLVVEGVAFVNTLVHYSKVTGTTLNEMVLSLEAFVGFVMVAALILNAMVNERKRMIEDLARYEKLNLIGEMAAGIAHEIRNPMTTVRGFLQLLTRNEENAEKSEFYHLMINELDRANSIITEYLMLARNRPLELTLHNLNDILQAIRPLLEADALNSDKRLDISLGDVPGLPIDEREIRQLILNLTRNGLEAMEPGGRLTIQSFTDKNSVILAVKDEGKGIEPHVIKNLGTPFLTTKENGTGLGLAVSYSIAARHNAVINVDSGPTGTTFYLKFKIKNSNR